MPNSAKRDAIARQWQLLKCLPSRGPGMTTQQLVHTLAAEGFTINKRTIQRDLNLLTTLFPLVCNDKDTPYRWHWMPSAEFDLPSLSMSEALSLQLLAQYLRPLLPTSILRVLETKFQSADSKLAALDASNTCSRWPAKIRSVPPNQPLLPPTVEPAILDTVQEALLADQQLDVIYLGRRAENAVPLRLNPQALVLRAPVTYLVASAFDYEDVRLFALHRIQAASRTEQPVRRLADFSLETYISSGALEFGDGAALSLVAEINARLAKNLEETSLATDMTLTPADQLTRLTATVADSWQLRWWILSQGAAIKVLEPVSLQNEIIATLKRTLALYEATAPNGDKKHVG